jgi:hypothetical protein
MVRPRPWRGRRSARVVAAPAWGEEPADPFVALGVSSAVRPVPRPSTDSVGLSARPSAVFPSHAPPVVYSTGPLERRPRRDRRGARTTSSLVALGVALWWATDRGLSALADLFGGAPAP